MRYLLIVILFCLSACEPVYAASVVSSGTFQAYTGSASRRSVPFSKYTASFRTGSATTTTKATPITADFFTFWDSVTAGLRKLTWGNIVTALNALYQPIGTYITSVSGTLPIVSSGGTTPVISLASVPFKNISSANRSGLGTAAFTATTAYDVAGAAAGITTITGNAGTATKLNGGMGKVVNVTRDTTLATGNVSYTGVGFQPSAVEMMCATSGANGSFSKGWYDGTTYAVQYTNEVPNTQISTSYVGVVGTSPGNTLITVASFDSDGITLTYTKSGSPTGTITCTMLLFK